MEDIMSRNLNVPTTPILNQIVAIRDRWHIKDARFYRPAACQPIKSLHHFIDDAQRTERT
jgi:hypothetical protein